MNFTTKKNLYLIAVRFKEEMKGSKKAKYEYLLSYIKEIIT